MVILPDWSSGIATQITTFLSWGTLADPLKMIVGAAVGATIAILFMSVFTRH